MADINKNIDSNQAAGVILIVLLIVGGFVYWNYANQQNGTTVLPTTQQTVSELQQATSPQSDVKVGKTSEATDDVGYKHIYAEVTNSGEPKTGVSLQATLYDANGTVIGTALGAVQNLGKGETKPADIIIIDSKQKAYTKFKVDINGAY